MWYAPSCPTGQSTPPLHYNVPTRLPRTYRLISSEWLPLANGCSKFAHPGPPGSKGEGAEEEEMKWVIIRPKVGSKQWQMGGWICDVFAVLCCECEWLQRSLQSDLNRRPQIYDLSPTNVVLLIYLMAEHLPLASPVTDPWRWTSWTNPQECTLHVCMKNMISVFLQGYSTQQ